MISHVYFALLHVAGTAYENLTLQSHTQRLIRRKVSNAFGFLLLKAPKRAWQDGRVNKLKVRAPKPSRAECARLNREAARSV